MTISISSILSRFLMESELFYDSLEESSDYDSMDRYSLPRNSKNHRRKMHKLCEGDLPDDVIPFYDKKLSRSEVNLRKNDFPRQGSGDNKKKLASKKHTSYKNPNNKLQSKSYLDIFYAKSGIDNSRNNEETLTTNLVETSPKSFRTCDDFDVDSIYLKSGANSASSYSNEDYVLNRREDDSISYTYERKFIGKLQEMYSISLDTKPENKLKSKRTSKVPELGKLGPELQTDKLELLKRRQLYGKMVSRSNRIKMMERKAVRDLQNEIKNSKVCL